MLFHQHLDPIAPTTTSLQEKKNPKNIERLLEHVVGNLGVFLASFHAFTNNLKSMNNIFVTLLDKF